MDMLERVARAIAENQHQGWLYDQEAVAMLDPERVAKARKFLRKAARAAIEAMRAELLVHLSRYAANDPERYGMQSAIDAIDVALSPSGEK